MTDLYIVPIEPLVERYTESWYRNLPKAFGEDFNVKVIDGTPLASTVITGTFLDINSTIAYKSSQLQKIAQLFFEYKVKQNSVFFFSDVEFWGIESVRLMAQMNNVKIKIYGFMHAASHTIEDAFAIAAPYQKFTELGWFHACDKLFFGSEYSLNAFLERRIKVVTPNEYLNAKKKLVNVGNPLFADDYEKATKPKLGNQIIISNRFDIEKRPNISLDMAYILKKRRPDLNIVVTTSRPKFTSNKNWLLDKARGMEQDGIISIHSGLSKKEYHKFLADSSVMLSNSIEENFGYCVAEAMVYGTHPVVKRAFSHPELLGQNCDALMFDDEDEIVDIILRVMDGEIDLSNSLMRNVSRYYTKPLEVMTEIMSQEFARD